MIKSINNEKTFTNVSTNLIEDHDATVQNLKLLLMTQKGEMFGDPYFGTNLKKFLFDQNDAVLQDIIIDDIYTAIATFMPQIKVTRKDIVLERTSKGVISVKIKAINNVNFTTDLYTIALQNNEE